MTISEIELVQTEIDIINARISCLQANIYSEEKKLYPLKVRLFELTHDVSVGKEFPGQGIDCPHLPIEV